MKNKTLSVYALLPWNVRTVLYLFSFSALVFNKSLCISVCPFIDKLQEQEFLFNLAILSVLHIFIREILYYIFQKPFFKDSTLPRHAYYLSLLSWITIGFIAFLFHYLRYPSFPIESHLKLLSSYLLIGGGLIAQLEYTIYEIQYKKKVKRVDYSVFNEKISKRLIESFAILTIVPAVMYLLILTRYQYDAGGHENMIDELTSIIALSVAVALVSAYSFGQALREDTQEILNSISSIRKGEYNINPAINRADELGEISIAIETMSSKIQESIQEIKTKDKELLQQQEEKNRITKNLMDSFIQLIASAIDAKSKYTGGHCNRVPELAIMLANEASKCTEGIFKDYNLDTEEKRYELEISSWLHDCGKVTTPEYVVDKATKLETIYNRIHEIRTRCEVIYRDLHIQALEKKLDGQEVEKVDEWLGDEQDFLMKDFEFIATINIGSEFTAPEDIKRIENIAKREWTRHFDNRIGLAHEERKRVLATKTSTPAKETLLDDKLQHIIPREDFDYDEYAKFGFKQEVPEHLYNLGEIYNLSIQRGTLTNEERFKINEHITMTIKMLEILPFPENLKNVPLFAGAHHETLVGTGYPRKLLSDDIPLPSRMIAVADVFEALTASDRPYKEAKPLSEAIRILKSMVKNKHLDKDVFELFLTSGIFQKYADEYLNKFQTDKVDISKYID